MSRPIAVIINDVHYDLNTLPLAEAAMKIAIDKANELNVPLVINGDLHNTKANLRGECVNAMIKTFAKSKTKIYVNIGNHCLINQKSKEHSLNFLAPYAIIIDKPKYIEELDSYIIPYQSDTNDLIRILHEVPIGGRLFLHQGVKDALAGEYIQDPSAIDSRELANYRTILGHYHAKQDIKCGRPRKGSVGLASFTGTPYTTTFAEANDHEKGIHVLLEDGSLEFVPTKLRKHVIIEMDNTGIISCPEFTSEDLIWVKITDKKEILINLSKRAVGEILGIKQDFRLDLIPTDTTTHAAQSDLSLTQGELLDNLIDSLTNTTDERKARLKELWKNSVCG